VPDLSDQIEQTATDGVQEAAADGRSVKGIPLPDLIAADKYLRGQEAVSGTNENGGPKSGWGRTKLARFTPGGPTT
jgi:hypothetical protein